MTADPDRTVRDLLDRLSDCRVRVVLDNGRPVIRPPRSGLAADEQARLDKLLPLLREHRDAIIARLSPEPAPEVAATPPVPSETEPWPCRATCGRWFYAPRAEVREFYASPAFCDRPNCPQR